MRQWLIRHRNAIAGALISLPGAWSGFKWMLDWGGRIDVFRTWGSVMMDALPTIPPWASLVLIVIGMLLIWLDLRRARGPGPQAAAIQVQVETQEPFRTDDWDKPLEKQFRIKFKNETVLLDGFEFIECTFDNVTFKYQGTKPFRFTGKTSGNSRKVTTDNKIVGQAFILAMSIAKEPIDYEIFKTGTRPSHTDASRQKELVAQGRKFVSRTVAERPRDPDFFKTRLESDIAFLSLRPYLSKEFLGRVEAQRTIYVPRENTNMPALADWYIEELDRLEKELQ
jgi:hypothetical protein